MIKNKYIILVHQGKYDYYYQKDNANTDGLTKLLKFFGGERSKKFLTKQNICLVTGSDESAASLTNDLSKTSDLFVGMAIEALVTNSQFNARPAKASDTVDFTNNTGLMDAIRSLGDDLNLAIVISPNDILNNFSENLEIASPGIHDHTKVTYMRFRMNTKWADVSSETLRFNETFCINDDLPFNFRTKVITPPNTATEKSSLHLKQATVA